MGIKFKKPFSWKVVLGLFLGTAVTGQVIKGFATEDRILDRWSSEGDVLLLLGPNETKPLDASVHLNIYNDMKTLAMDNPIEQDLYARLDVDGPQASELSQFGYGNMPMDEDYGPCSRTTFDTDYAGPSKNFPPALLNRYKAAFRKLMPDADYSDFGPREFITFQGLTRSGTACSKMALVRYGRNQAIMISEHETGAYVVSMMERDSRHSYVFNAVNFFRNNY